MRRRNLTAFAAAAGLLALSGCSYLAPLLHHGDGKFSVGGPIGYGFRYLDLGEIDLTRTASRTFQFGGLFANEMVVTLEVTENETNSFSKPRPMHLAVIRLTMRTLDDEVVVDETSRLSEWTRGYGANSKISSYYLRGKSREVPIRENLTRSEKLDVKPHGGWVTYFKPSVTSTYRLTVEVMVPNAEAVAARVKLNGW
ncbi:MAG: hypothetical protein ACRCWJ_16490 [Casimicrobium sp.]